jgi:hypothetical protein
MEAGGAVGGFSEKAMPRGVVAAATKKPAADARRRFFAGGEKRPEEISPRVGHVEELRVLNAQGEKCPAEIGQRVRRK